MTWTCKCGYSNDGTICGYCGAFKPEEPKPIEHVGIWANYGDRHERKKVRHE